MKCDRQIDRQTDRQIIVGRWYIVAGRQEIDEILKIGRQMIEKERGDSQRDDNSDIKIDIGRWIDDAQVGYRSIDRLIHM